MARQREIGLDVVNKGEYAKGGDWLRYMLNRFAGFTDIEAPHGLPLIEQGRDRKEFADFYNYCRRARHAVLYAGRYSTSNEAKTAIVDRNPRAPAE